MLEEQPVSNLFFLLYFRDVTCPEEGATNRYVFSALDFFSDLADIWLILVFMVTLTPILLSFLAIS